MLRPPFSQLRPNACKDQLGIVGFNLALTIAFALFAVIELSRVVLAATQIDDRVKVIVTEIGPGSNVSRLDETQKLNETGRIAEEILAAAQPLSGQAQTIVETAVSIDGHVSDILANASEINTTARGINASLSALLPVVRNINGDGTLSPTTGGVAAINQRVDRAIVTFAGIKSDFDLVLGQLGVAGPQGHGPTTIHGHVNSINCALVVLAPTGCGQ